MTPVCFEQPNGSGHNDCCDGANHATVRLGRTIRGLDVRGWRTELASVVHEPSRLIPKLTKDSVLFRGPISDSRRQALVGSGESFLLGLTSRGVGTRPFVVGDWPLMRR